MLELEEDWEIGDEDMEVGVADVRPDVENTVEVGRGLEVVGTEETTDEGGVELGVTGAVLVGDETDELVDKDEGIVENGCRLRGRLIGCDEVVVGLSDKIEPGSVRRIPLRPGKSPLRSSSPAVLVDAPIKVKSVPVKKRRRGPILTAGCNRSPG